MSRERLIKRNTTHGLSKSRVYRIWDGMRQRCFNPNSQGYSYYGGRDIPVTICDDWQTFEGFYADVGDPPDDSLTLDRIDNDGPYAPWNYRWATRAVQNANRRHPKRGAP